MMVAMIFARAARPIVTTTAASVSVAGLFWFWGWDMGSDGTAVSDPVSRRAPRSEPFYKSVFAFVFGLRRRQSIPARTKGDRRLHPAAQRGRIAAVDLVRLMGWTSSAPSRR